MTEKRFEAVLKLDELRRKQQRNIESVNMINRLLNEFGLSNQSHLEVMEKLTEESELIANQIIEIKENL
ncbi:MAG: hypothetical protein ACOC22_01175 [bacterium]